MIAATEKDHRALYPDTDPVVVDLQNLDPNQLRVTTVGTGRTTGHILNMEVKNLTDRDMEIHYTPVFVPSDGKHQPYIVPGSGTIEVPAGSEVEYPLHGYCADNRKPPIGKGDGTPSIDDWERPNTDYFDDEGLNPDLMPTPEIPVFDNGNAVFPPFLTTPNDIINTLRELLGLPYPPPRPTPVAPDELNPASLRDFYPDDRVINLPTNVLPRSIQDDIFEGTETGDPLAFDVGVLQDRNFPVIDLELDVDPQTTANLLYDAIVKITDVVNERVEAGLYDFPFPPEEVIQQTFWIYTGSLRETPYEFEDFRERVALQFETVRGIPIEEAREEEGRQFEEGVENFWSGFQIIGEEAKVFKGTQGVKTEDSDEEQRTLPIGTAEPEESEMEEVEEEEEDEPTGRNYFDCDESTYPDVTYLSEEDYQNGTAHMMQGVGKAGGIASALFRGLRNYNPDINFRDAGIFNHPFLTPHAIRYFITWEHSYDPETNTCTVTLRVYDGMPYDPSREPQLTVEANASFGEESACGWYEVDTERMCYHLAGKRATQKLIDSGLFSEGFEHTCPDHLVYNPDTGLYCDPNQ